MKTTEKTGLELVIDLVEAARVRVESPPQTVGDEHISSLLRGALTECHKLQRAEIKHSMLSNRKGSRRITWTNSDGKKIEIRESEEESPSEDSVMAISHSLPAPNGPAGVFVSVRFDAKQLFEFAEAILEWYDFKAYPGPDHPDYPISQRGSASAIIAEWMRLSAQAFRAEAKLRYEKSGETQARLALALEAKADDYEELAVKIDDGEWQPK